ncbi:MAG: SDR family NAD(P)-dependent oxidoreductase [Actinomycetaceae bacterium]|nr:SDR family NAD(P)-dependent oxidoreductase [Actinomycetaceae bacterium]
MARILVTGSTDGVGRASAATLLQEGHDVVVHGRSSQRLHAISSLLDQGAQAVIGDLADLGQVRSVADQANALGPYDAVIHNAGVYSGPALLPVNVVAPYVLTACIERPARLIYLSSSMHHGGKADIAGADWSGSAATHTYSDSKLFLTTLMAAVARLWPQTLSHAVDPGWVPTKMGGAAATDDLDLGHVTQVWLATSDDAVTLPSGQYWYHQEIQPLHRAVNDIHFQEELLGALAKHTSIDLPRG